MRQKSLMLNIRFFVIPVFMLLSIPANAAVVTYSSSADFITGLGGAAALTQNFDSYNHLVNLNGVEVLPGVSATSNLPDVTAWDLSNPGNAIMFAHGGSRSGGDTYYQISFNQAYNAFALDIVGYNPEAAVSNQHGVMAVTTVGGIFMFDITQTNPLESDPIFFGVISDSDILSIRWNEGPEINGTGNEETGLDNFIVANAPVVPVPAAAWLFGSGLIGLIGIDRRKKA